MAIKEQLLNSAILNLKISLILIIVVDVFVFTFSVDSYLFRNPFEKQNS
jgi:hypothetical protein